MRWLGAVLLLLLPAAGLAEEDQQSEFDLIVNLSNPTDSLPRPSIAAMFLKKVEHWPDGVQVTPVDHQEGPLRESFSRAVHKRSDAALSAYWLAQIYRGTLTQPRKLSNQEVVDFVRTNRGAIGYVRRGTELTGVKRISIQEPPS